MNVSKKKDVFSILLTIFNCMFILISIYIVGVDIFKPYYKIKGLSTIIVAIVEIILLIILIKLSLKINDKWLKIISIINIIIFIAILFIVGFNLMVKPSWDFGEIYHTGIAKAQGTISYLPDYYYKMYPNNIFVTLLLSWIFKVFGIMSINYLNGAIVLNSILETVAIVVTYFLIKDIYGLKISTIYSFMILVATPFYLYAPIVYTDTFSLMYLPIAYLLYKKYRNSEKWRYLILIGIFASLGIAIKNNVIIGIIALLIFVIFELRNIKKIMKVYIGILIPILIINAIISGISQTVIPVKISDAGFPYNHWIMMGLQGNGEYSQADVKASLDAGPNKENIEKFDSKVIKERLDNFGADGYIKFLGKKTSFTWGDGTMWGTFYLNMFPTNKGKMYSYIVKGNNQIFLSFVQGTQVVMFILILLGAIGLFNDKKNLVYVFNICIMGVFLFLILWETCPRYTFFILPIMLASASNGVSKIMNILNKEKIKIKE